MTNHQPHTFLLFFFLALFILPAAGQTTVKITADKTQILIGEQIRLTLEADIPENEAIGFFNPDTLPHFEILRRDIIDTNNTSKGTVLKGVIYITSFDSGHWVIPPILLRDSIYTDSIPVDVGYTPFDTQKPYNDIKEVIEAGAAKKESDDKWWYIAAAVLVLALIFYFVLRRKPKPVQAVSVQEDAYVQALRELDGLAGNTGTKDLYYSTLVNIFRMYVLRRKGIESMQQTTGDLVEQIRILGLPAYIYTELAAALRFSDLVKFARFDASAEDAEKTRLTVKRSVQLIEELHVMIPASPQDKTREAFNHVVRMDPKYRLPLAGEFYTPRTPAAFHLPVFPKGFTEGSHHDRIQRESVQSQVT